MRSSEVFSDQLLAAHFLMKPSLIVWGAIFVCLLALVFLFLLSSRIGWKKKSEGVYVPHLEKIEKSILYDRRLDFQRLCSCGIVLSTCLTLFSLLALLTVNCTGYNPFQGTLKISMPSRLNPKSMSAVVFLVDCSGSMANSFSASSEGQSKISLVKDALKNAITSSDEKLGMTTLLGLDSFARVCTTVVPLTYDRKYFISQIDALYAVEKDAINGTATGYALMKALLEIISSRVLEEKVDLKVSIPQPKCIIISDGIEEPNPSDANEPYRSMRVLQSLKIAKQNNILVDYVLLGSGWDEISPDEQQRLRQAVEDTGGALRHVEYESALTAIVESMIVQNQQKETYTIPQVPSDGMIFMYMALVSVSAIFLLRTLSFVFEKRRLGGRRK